MQFFLKPITLKENLLSAINLFSEYPFFAVNWKEITAFSFTEDGIEDCKSDPIINDWSVRLQ